MPERRRWKDYKSESTWYFEVIDIDEDDTRRGEAGGGPTKGASDPLVESVSSFQREEGMEPPGSLDPATARRLVEVYGG